MMFAGHETTANTLSATLAFLAVYQKEQSIAYNEISRIIEKNGTKDLTIEAYEELIKTRSVFLEALRLVSPAPMLIRHWLEDTPLKITQPANDSGQGEKGCTEKAVVIEAGQVIIIDMIGLRNYYSSFSSSKLLLLSFLSLSSQVESFSHT